MSIIIANRTGKPKIFDCNYATSDFIKTYKKGEDDQISWQYAKFECLANSAQDNLYSSSTEMKKASGDKYMIQLYLLPLNVMHSPWKT